MLHDSKHPNAGQVVKIAEGTKHPQYEVGGADFLLEDWWDRVTGRSWMDANGNPAAMIYAIRSGSSGLPLNNEVVYGKIDGMGCIFHVTELDLGEEEATA